MLTVTLIGAVAGIATITFIFNAMPLHSDAWIAKAFNLSKLRFLNSGVFTEFGFMFGPMLLGLISSSETTVIIGVVSGITMSITTYRLKRNKAKYYKQYYDLVLKENKA